MSAMDVTQVRSLLAQAQQGAKGKEAGGAAQAFADLLSDATGKQQQAEKAFEAYAVEGKGELHDVMAQMAKADVAFKFLIEVRNKLTDAYTELSRLQV
jgi:flagellar hook-basal body complex protein FliE